MDKQNSNLTPNDLVDRAMASLQNRAAARSGPNPQLIEQTLARLAAAQQFNPKPEFNWRSIIMKPTFQLSAAAVIAVVLTGMFWLSNASRSSIAFADTLVRIAQVHSVSYTTDVTMTTPNGSKNNIRMKVIIVEPGVRMRTVFEKAGMIDIINGEARKVLMLNSQTKTAQIWEFTNPDDRFLRGDMLREFRNFDAKDFHRIGEKTINGHLAVGFFQKKTTPMPEDQTVWVDPTTELPVEMDTTFHNGFLPDSSQVMTDFQWNVPVNDEMFSVTPPAGYHIETLQMNAAPVKEKDLIDGLKSAANWNGGKFPDRFDNTTIKSISMSTRNSLKASDVVNLNRDALVALLQKRSNQHTNQITSIVRALAFIADSRNGSDWHYAGKGVALGHDQTPILWYLPAGAQNYRVIYGNLTIRDVSRGQLPKVPSISLSNSASHSAGE